MDLAFDTNALSNSHTNLTAGSDNFLLNDTSTGNVTYDISGNTSTTGASNASIAAVMAATGGTMNGTINGNTIGVSGMVGTGSPTGILVEAYGAGTHTAVITNNTIYDFSTQAILVDASQGSATLNATVTGNTIQDPGGSATADLRVIGSATNGDTDDLNIVVGNALTASLKNTFGGTKIVELDNQGGGLFNLSKAGSTSTDSTTHLPTPTTVITDDNTTVTTVNVSPTNAAITLVATTPATPGGEPTLTNPVISGTPQEGVTLTASAAVADDPSATIVYQWQENFGSGYVNIAGATGTGPTFLSYTPVEADEGATLRIVATSTDTNGLGTTATSIATTQAVADVAPAFTTSPTISGNAAVGQVLTATAAVANDSDATVSYQWERNGSAINGATGLFYRVSTADVGDALEHGCDFERSRR